MLAAFVAALTLTIAPALATTSLDFDKVWWQSLDFGSKLYVIEGMIAGTKSRECAYGVEQFKLVPGKGLGDGACPDWIDGTKQGYITYTKAFGYYVHSIDLFYEAHPKRWMIEPGGLFSYCLMDDAPGAHETGMSCDNFGKDAD
jgi:hypothetical protein